MVTEVKMGELGINDLLIAIGAGAYVVSPIDLMPLNPLDDILVSFIALFYIMMRHKA